jgi:putative effector of murein hydrolase
VVPELARSPLFGVALTTLVYVLAEALYARLHKPFTHPVAVSIATIITTLVLLGVPYEAYAVGGKLLLFLLGPSVVALAVPLYVQRTRLEERALPIAAGILAGSVTSIVTASGTAKLLGASHAVVLSLAPKSVTTPIAIGLAERIGGIPPLTACVVVLTGCIGAALGPELCRMLGIRADARGGRTRRRGGGSRDRPQRPRHLRDPATARAIPRLSSPRPTAARTIPRARPPTR